MKRRAFVAVIGSILAARPSAYGEEPRALGLFDRRLFLKDTTTNVLIRYELIGFTIDSIAYLDAPPSRIARPESIAETRRCVDAHIVVETTRVAETLIDERRRVLTDLAREMLFAFNYRSERLPEHVNAEGKRLNLF